MDTLEIFGISRRALGFFNFLEIIERSSKLRMLRLGAAELNGESMYLFGKSLSKSQIKELIIEMTHIDSKSMKALASSLPSNKITKFICNGCDLKLQGFVALAESIPLTRVKHLEITNNRYLGVGALIDVLQFVPSILQLSLADSNLDYSDIERLSTNLPFTRIRILDLSSNRFGDIGALRLAEVVARTEITELNVKHCGIHLLLASTALKNAKPSMRVRIGRVIMDTDRENFGRFNFVSTEDQVSDVVPQQVLVSDHGCLNCVIS